MPISQSDREYWVVTSTKEFSDTQAPYFGINTFDVKTENWEATIQNIRQQQKDLSGAFGVTTHLWSVRDDEDQRRVCWVNYYPENIGARLTPEWMAASGAAVMEFFDLIETYDWYAATEEPSNQPQVDLPKP